MCNSVLMQCELCYFEIHPELRLLGCCFRYVMGVPKGWYVYVCFADVYTIRHIYAEVRD